MKKNSDITYDSVPSLEKVHAAYRELTETLIRKGLQITTMESCTSGLIASLITDTEGASAVLKGAAVTYSNEAKIRNGVPAEIIRTYGVYSEETAGAMSEACRKLYDSDLGVGVTGSFGNVDPANSDSVPGEVYISLSIGRYDYQYFLELPTGISRFESKLVTADAVCTFLIKCLRDMIF